MFAVKNEMVKNITRRTDCLVTTTEAPHHGFFPCDRTALVFCSRHGARRKELHFSSLASQFPSYSWLRLIFSPKMAGG